MVERQLYLYEYVDASYEDVVKVLQEEGGHLFEKATTNAATHADTVVSQLVVDLAGFEVAHDVTVHVGEFNPVERLRSKVHLSWEAADGTALFPHLDADFEIAALAFHPPLTQVTIVGSYTPPGGPLGAATDAMFGHRIAEAALHNFLHTVIEHLEEHLT